MAKQKLTKKQRGFVRDYLETGIGSLAVKKNYDVKNDKTARAMAYENLTKPYIVKSIQDSLSDELLRQKHLELLNAVTLDRFTFKKDDSDEVIRDSISQLAGHEVIYIRQDETVKTAYVRVPDSNTQDKALDKAYKIKGTYAPDKSLNVNLEYDVSRVDRDIADKYEEELRQQLLNVNPLTNINTPLVDREPDQE